MFNNEFIFMENVIVNFYKNGIFKYTYLYICISVHNMYMCACV